MLIFNLFFKKKNYMKKHFYGSGIGHSLVQVPYFIIRNSDAGKRHLRQILDTFSGCLVRRIG